jgi:RNA recognition motif-containing protein
MKKLYVGNLSFDTTDDSLRTLFSEHGEVESATVITDRYSGRSKGFGFVEMATEEAAQAAINAVNGRSVDGREVKVAEAKPRVDRDRGYGDRRGGNRGRSRW